MGPSATLTQEYSESPYKARVSVRAGADTTETDLAFVEIYLAHKPDIFRYHDKLSFYAKLKILFRDSAIISRKKSYYSIFNDNLTQRQLFGSKTMSDYRDRCRLVPSSVQLSSS